MQQDVHRQCPHTGQPQLEATETKFAFSTNCRARKTLFGPIYFNKHLQMMPLTNFFFFLSILEVQWAPHSLFPTFIFTLVEGNQVPWPCYGYNLKVAFQESILENWSLAMYFLLELRKKKRLFWALAIAMFTNLVAGTRLCWLSGAGSSAFFGMCMLQCAYLEKEEYVLVGRLLF